LTKIYPKRFLSKHLIVLKRYPFLKKKKKLYNFFFNYIKKKIYKKIIKLNKTKYLKLFTKRKVRILKLKYHYWYKVEQPQRDRKKRRRNKRRLRRQSRKLRRFKNFMRKTLFFKIKKKKNF